jgi:hypothetical protein
MTSVVLLNRPSFFSDSRLRERLVVVIGGMTLVDWISQIELEVTGWARRTGSDLRVTRLHHALRFALSGRIFAVLRVDDDGLFFRRWELDGTHWDYAGLEAELARTLIKQSTAMAESARLN